MQSVHDPGIFGNVAAVFIVGAVTASWIPAMRAARLDPKTALHAD